MIPIYHSGSYPPKALAMKFSNMNYVPKSGLVAGAQLKDWVDRASRELVEGLTKKGIKPFKMPKQMKEETEKDVKKLLCSKSSEVQEVKQTSPSKTVTKLPLAPPITTLSKSVGLPRHSRVPIVGTTGGSTSSGSRSSCPLTSSGSRHIQVALRRKYGTDNPIINALKAADLDSAQALLGLGMGDVNETDGSTTPLLLATKNGPTTLVKTLIQGGADVNANFDVTALIIASGQGKESLVKILIEAGADVNAKSDGWTPLMKAISSGNKSIVKTLLAAGADANCGMYHDYSPDLPLTLAFEGGHQDIAKMLLDAGANPNSVDILARVLNVKGYSKAVIELLLQAGAKISGAALAGLAERGQIIMLQFLIEKGGNVDACSHCMTYTTCQGDVFHWADRSLLFLAVTGGHTSTASLLIESGADVNKGSASGYDSPDKSAFDGGVTTPLIQACIQGHEDIVKLMMNNKADLEAEGEIYLGGSWVTRMAKGTAIQFAKAYLIEAKEERKKNYRSIIGLLIEAGAQDFPKVDINKTS